jgi:hypothetical protein
MLLDRRHFVAGLPALLPAALAASPEETPRTRFYVLERYFLEQGSQPARLNEFFSRWLIPAAAKVHKGPLIVMEAVLAPHLPEVAVLFGVESAEQVFTVPKALFADKDFSRAFDKWEEGEAPFVNSSASLLQATDYSPEIVAPAKPAGTPRYFELRVYHSPTRRQNVALHERFSSAEINIFHRCGINPLLYTTTVFGDNRPDLTYLIPFDSLAAREKAWAAFSADPEWVKLRKSSTDKAGQISIRSNISIYRATAYSPIR